MSEYKLVPLADIETISNYREVDPPTAKSSDVIELSESIGKYGVKQPVLLRSHPKKAGKYQLIFGHRRLLAAGLAKLQEIPATIEVVEDSDILELQVTENLQRKNPHPIDEAIAYKALQDDYGYKIDELSKRFGKSAVYIAERLKLNDLIPELMKFFKHDKMLLGHALVLCKLQPADQKESLEEAGHDGFLSQSVSELKSWVDNTISNKLSTATFDTGSATLLPAAGSCAACNKRSGGNGLLFKSEPEKDVCFDRACFEQKTLLFMLAEVKAIAETKPDMVFVRSYRDPEPAVSKYLKEMKIPVFKDDEYRTHTWEDSDYNVPKKAFVISGWEVGKTIKVYLKGTKAAAKAASGKADAQSIQLQVSGIKERTKRAEELDQEKIYCRIKDELSKPALPATFLQQKIKTLSEVDNCMIVWALWEKAGYSLRDKWKKNLKISDANAEKLYQSFAQLSNEQLTYMVRTLAISDLMGMASDSESRLFAKKLALQLGHIPVKKFEEEQAAIAAKRQTNALKRIADLQASVKEKPAAKAPAKKAPVKPVKKAVAKKKKTAA